MSSRINGRKLPAFSPAADVAAAYDALAADYDRQLLPAQWVRARLWRRMDALFEPGQKVLDVTAGTGLDAAHLVERGVHVTACDISSAMLAQLNQRLPSVKVFAVDFNSLNAAPWREQFDGIISTFAGLNTSAELTSFARAAADLLRPAGTLFVHMLNRLPIREIIAHLTRFQIRTGLRKLVGSHRAVEVGLYAVEHYVSLPMRLYRRYFAAEFTLRRIEAQALLSPAAAQSSNVRVNRWETALATRAPFHSLGTFYSLELTRR